MKRKPVQRTAMARERSARTRRALACALALVVLLASGCSRQFYRLQADWDAYRLIDEKVHHLHMPLEDYRIDVDPRSRMFDPTNPDFPMMPPDDPAAHRLMHCVDGKSQFPCWHRSGDAKDVQNPHWAEALPLDENGVLVLDLEKAVHLARLNSLEYQSNLEDLYLSSLDVAFERFRFDAQFFGGTEQSFQTAGRNLSGVGSTNTLQLDHDAQVRKLFASGGELVAGFANSFVWQFSGPNTYTATTLLDFAFTQPLLRFASRAVVLETLTLAERSLLYNVRQMERFRRGFYTQVYTGRDAGRGPQRRGGFFGGAGLTGFTGVGGGGFGGVGGAAFGGGGFAGGAGAAQAGGFLGLLQDQQQIRNQEFNVAGLRDSLAQLQATYDAGRIDRFQVDQARQALYNAQSVLLTTKAAYESSLDNFKVGQLGLPPDIPLRAEDSTLDQFILIDPRITEAQRDISDVLERLRLTDENPDLETLAEILSAADQLRRTAAGHLSLVEQDLAALEEILPERRENLQRLLERDEVRTGEVDPSAYDVAAMERRARQIQDDYSPLVQRFDTTAAALASLHENLGTVPPATLRREALAAITELSGQLVDIMLLQARAKLESTTLVEINVNARLAYCVALSNRLDLMNARGNLVDIWRLIEFNANDLRSDLDVVFSGDISSTDDNPFRFRDTAGRLRLGLEFDAPITRLGERNVYRQALIEYQQARRNYYSLRDQLYQGLRGTLRTIELNALNFELRRASVLTAINQVELTQLRLNQPPEPGATAQLGATTARDLVDSLSALLNVQNDFLSVWVNYEAQRISLDFDLGTMRLDHHGLWIDPGSMTDDELRPLCCTFDDAYHHLWPDEAALRDEVLNEEASDATEPEELPMPLDATPPGELTEVTRTSAEFAWPAETETSRPVSTSQREPPQPESSPSTGQDTGAPSLPRAGWKPARRTAGMKLRGTGELDR